MWDNKKLYRTDFCICAARKAMEGGITVKIKIMVAFHKPYWFMDDPVYLPVQVGHAFHEDLGRQGDDQGENIGRKNPYYCELTALFWGWKNLSADALGLVHYRRYFTRAGFLPLKRLWRRRILSKKELEACLRQAPVILPRKRRYFIETNASHYFHFHRMDGLEALMEVISGQFPDYAPAMERVLSRRWAHMFNIFVMRRDYLDRYCRWLFAVLDATEKRLVASGRPLEPRGFGYLSELMLDMWLETEQVPYIERPVTMMEHQNWVMKIGRFVGRKLRACFIRSRNEQKESEEGHLDERGWYQVQ